MLAEIGKAMTGRYLGEHGDEYANLTWDRLRYLITQREAKKFGRGFDPYALYKHISGVNAVRLRRLLASLTGEDYPADPSAAFRQLRTATLSNAVELPSIDLDKDIGGYKQVKDRLGAEILAILSAKDKLSDPQQIDNPYLDASSNGLTYCVERLKASPLVGHMTLSKSERSELADLAAERL